MVTKCKKVLATDRSRQRRRTWIGISVPTHLYEAHFNAHMENQPAPDGGLRPGHRGFAGHVDLQHADCAGHRRRAHGQRHPERSHSACGHQFPGLSTRPLHCGARCGAGAQRRRSQERSRIYRAAGRFLCQVGHATGRSAPDRHPGAPGSRAHGASAQRHRSTRRGHHRQGGGTGAVR